MSGDLISRSTLMNDIIKRFNCRPYIEVGNKTEYIHDILSRQPTIEAAPVVHGFNDNRNYHEADEFRCSVCGIHITDWNGCIYDEDLDDVYFVEYVFKYCPNCGAKMKGGK